MSRLPLPIRALLLAIAATTLHAQITTPKKPRAKPSQQTLNPNIVVLDPSHGGPDNGATLGPNSLEKDATVAFADRLRTVLAAHGFTVVLTHDSASDQPTPDQRAELANHSRAATCLLIHASNGGHGVHLFTSSLTPISPLSVSFQSSSTILPWETAQATSLQQSIALTFALSDAFTASKIPLVAGHVSVAPIDNMTCPAVVLELAPFNNAAATDSGYQQKVADSVLTALVVWRAKLVAQETPAEPPPAKPAAPPPVRKPKPIVAPIETPVAPDSVPTKPEPPPGDRP